MAPTLDPRCREDARTRVAGWKHLLVIGQFTRYLQARWCASTVHRQHRCRVHVGDAQRPEYPHPSEFAERRGHSLRWAFGMESLGRDSKQSDSLWREVRE